MDLTSSPGRCLERLNPMSMAANPLVSRIWTTRIEPFRLQGRSGSWLYDYPAVFDLNLLEDFSQARRGVRIPVMRASRR